MRIILPAAVSALMDRFYQNGFRAWAVGGAVRDSLRGKAPGDWDLCTDATPEQTKALFADCRTVDTGIRHGTVTVLWQERPYEITTLRLESGYTDGRRPDAVTFTDDIYADLARRDFTVNAMACGPEGLLIDPYGGFADLQDRVLKCVGDPETRFREDGLRPLRGLRFCSTLGLRPDYRTAAALHSCADVLAGVASERIWAELKKLLTGEHFTRLLLDHADMMAVIIPEVGPAVGFDQRNPFHLYDVWEHSVRAAAIAPPDPVIRFAMLLHDLGKPGTLWLGEDGVGHFAGHSAASLVLAEPICRRLHLSNEERQLVCFLVGQHDLIPEDTDAFARRLLNRWGTERAIALLQVVHADNTAKAPRFDSRLATADALAERLVLLTEQDAVTDLGRLAVKGDDLLALGLRGPKVGAALRDALNRVLDGKLENEKDKLLAYVKEYHL